MVTRPEPGLSETVKKIQDLGWNVFPLPLMNIRCLNFELNFIESIQAIIFTSRQAVNYTYSLFAKQNVHYELIPVFTVGDSTARDALSLGFKIVESAHKNADALNYLIRKKLTISKGSLFFPVGKRQGCQLTNSLEKVGFHVLRKEVYEVNSIDCLSSQFKKELKRKQIHTILFFSSETGRFFINLMPKSLGDLLKNVHAIGISAKVKSILEYYQWKSIEIADIPCMEAMLSLLKKEQL